MDTRMASARLKGVDAPEVHKGAYNPPCWPSHLRFADEFFRLGGLRNSSDTTRRTPAKPVSRRRAFCSFEEEMKFGPAEMAQMMDSGKALIYSCICFHRLHCIGIALGAIVAIYYIFRRRAGHFRHHAADRSFQSGMPTVPVLPPIDAPLKKLLAAPLTFKLASRQRQAP
jgi:hypothetical protein